MKNSYYNLQGEKRNTWTILKQCQTILDYAPLLKILDECS